MFQRLILLIKNHGIVLSMETNLGVSPLALGKSPGPLCCNPEVHTIIHWDVTTPGHLCWCTVIHCLMFSTLTSNSTSLIGLCSASNILAFHRSDGSLSVSAFPTVALAARRALFQVVAWNTLVIILVVSTSIRTGDYLECKIEDFQRPDLISWNPY